MLKDDWVYVGHMLDMGQKALDFTEGVVCQDLPDLVRLLDRIVPPDEG